MIVSMQENSEDIHRRDDHSGEALYHQGGPGGRVGEPCQDA